MKTINKDSAKAKGYRALTSSYQLPQQQRMLDNVLGDMQRGKIDHVLVKDWDGVSVWRRAKNRRAR